MNYETPSVLFHVTTGRKVKAYHASGCIKSPVRGFDTLQAAMAWAMKVGRKVIMHVECKNSPQMLPDHHNAWGRAWWTDEISIDRVKCVYSAEGAWKNDETIQEQTMIDRNLQQAREAYEQDVLKHPTYHDGTPRKTWDELDSLCKESWCRHPLIQLDRESASHHDGI